MLNIITFLPTKTWSNANKTIVSLTTTPSTHLYYFYNKKKKDLHVFRIEHLDFEERSFYSGLPHTQRLTRPYPELGALTTPSMFLWDVLWCAQDQLHNLQGLVQSEM